jgi:hypothetical protein
MWMILLLHVMAIMRSFLIVSSSGLVDSKSGSWVKHGEEKILWVTQFTGT